ncbi:MAG: hypothetical protein U1E84_01135 [Rhodoferax sp.]
MADDLRRTRENLAFEVRQSSGAVLSTEQVQWLPVRAQDPQGEPLVASFMGDLQLRFVFRTPGMPDSALTADALTALDLNVQRALAIACLNFKRSNGTPIPAEFSKGIYVLRGIDAEHVANYLLDRVFWRKLLERFPSGVVVAVPKRGILYFADAGTPESVEELTRLAAKLLHTAGTATLSRQLYAFGDKGWRVHGPLPAPLTPDPVPVSAATRATVRDAVATELDAHDDEARLELAAKGQKMVILTIVANMGLRGVERQPDVTPWLLLALSVVVGVVALVGTVRMCSGLRRVQGEKIVFMVVSFVPLINILSLIYLSMKTTKLLRAAGWTVGLLGAKR